MDGRQVSKNSVRIGKPDGSTVEPPGDTYRVRSGFIHEARHVLELQAQTNGQLTATPISLSLCQSRYQLRTMRYDRILHCPAPPSLDVPELQSRPKVQYIPCNLLMAKQFCIPLLGISTLVPSVYLAELLMGCSYSYEPNIRIVWCVNR